MTFIKVGNCLITISKRKALHAVSKCAVLVGKKKLLFDGVIWAHSDLTSSTRLEIFLFYRRVLVMLFS